MATTRSIIVQQGDSLRKIAQREYGNPDLYPELVKTGIRGRLTAGQKIDIPDLAPPPPAQATPIVKPVSLANAPLPKQTVPEYTPVVPPQTQTVQPQVPQPAPAAMPPTYAPNVTSPTAPGGTGAPNYNKPLAQGGEQSFKILQGLKTGTISPTDVPITPAEKEAFSMYQNYSKYKDYNGEQLFSAIQKGELTPDPTNLLWRALGENGQPTDAMIQAYAQWDKASKSGATQGTDTAFLGGKWQTPKSIEELNQSLNAGQKSRIDNGGETVTTTETTTVQPGTSEYDQYRDMISTMFGVNVRPTSPEYEKSLLGLRGQYNVDAQEADLNAMRAEIEQVQANLRSRRQANLDQPVAMGVIAGRIGEIERQEMERLDYLARQENTLVNQLNTSAKAIDQIMKTKQMDYESAKEDYNQKFSQAMQMIDLFRAVKKDVKAEEQAKVSAQMAMEKARVEQIEKARDNARANLTLMYNNITEGGLNTAGIDRQQAIEIARLESQAGLPVGTFMDLRNKNPNAELKTQIERYDADGTKYFDMIMVDRYTGKPSIITMEAGFDPEKAQEMYGKRLDITKKAQDISQFGLETQLKEAQLRNLELTGEEKYGELYTETQYQGQGLVGTKPGTGTIIQAYGAESSRYKNGMHAGTDLRAATGTSIALPEGSWEVVKAVGNKPNTPTGASGGYGNYIKVKNRETGEMMLFGHLSKVNAKPGDVLDGGAIVGLSGNSGFSTAEHIHAEYYNSKGKQSAIEKSPYGSFYTGGTVVSRKEGSSKLSEGERKEISTKSLLGKFTSLLSDPEIRGADGKVSPDSYRALKQQWIAEGKDADDFDKKFKGYVNPTDYRSYGLESSILGDREYWIAEAEKFNADMQKKPATPTSNTARDTRFENIATDILRKKLQDNYQASIAGRGSLSDEEVNAIMAELNYRKSNQ